jgi:hypothetical protein
MTTRTKPKARRKSAKPGARTGRRWSARVAQRSDALDIKGGTFAQRSPKAVAQSLKRSADHSRRRKAGSYQSAMSMLNFFINRAGRSLPATRKKILRQAKTELRRLYHRE